MAYEDYKYYSYQRVVDDFRNQTFKKQITSGEGDFPFLIKKDFSGAFTAADEWPRWLERMNTYEFTNILFAKTAVLKNGNKVKVYCDKVWPNSANGVFVVNAFTLEQARTILEHNIKLSNFFNVSGVDFFEAESKNEIYKYSNSRTWIGYDTSDEHVPSDCDPRSWFWLPVKEESEPYRFENGSFNPKYKDPAIKEKALNDQFYYYAVVLKLSRERGLCSFEEKKTAL